jgi:hypothetical protein
MIVHPHTVVIRLAMMNAPMMIKFGFIGKGSLVEIRRTLLVNNIKLLLSLTDSRS